MSQAIIEYHIADIDGSWGIFREGVQIALRRDAADAIAFANFFADRETLVSTRPVRVSAGPCLHQELHRIRRAA